LKAPDAEYGDPTAIYAPGSTYEAKFEVDEDRGGGSCEMGLSYDNGTTFCVIKSIAGGCLTSDSYDS
jgi:hypothetical protein